MGRFLKVCLKGLSAELNHVHSHLFSMLGANRHRVPSGGWLISEREVSLESHGRQHR